MLASRDEKSPDGQLGCPIWFDNRDNHGQFGPTSHRSNLQDVVSCTFVCESRTFGSKVDDPVPGSDWDHSIGRRLFDYDIPSYQKAAHWGRIPNESMRYGWDRHHLAFRPTYLDPCRIRHPSIYPKCVRLSVSYPVARQIASCIGDSILVGDEVLEDDPAMEY